jgi:hypothetical protein
MKRTLQKIVMVAGGLCALLLCSCEMQDESVLEQQPVKFSLDLKDLPADGGRTGTSYIASVVVSVRNASHTDVVTSKKLSLFDFNGKFISEPVPLTPGSYYLAEFLVLDSNNKVIFASPIEGSAKAYLVQHPLEIKMDIIKNKVSEITPEVLDVRESSATDFGYATFSFKEIETFDFLISVFAYDQVKKKLVLSSADLSVKDLNQKFSYNRELPAATAKVTLPGRYSSFSLKVSRNGCLPYIKTFSTSGLKSYNGENGPLTIILKDGKLIFWNKLGSNDEVLNSEVGPDLEFFTGNDGLHVPANREYVTGTSGKAITIAPGGYVSTQRVHNLVLNDLPSILNPERGAIECYFFQNSSPIAYNHNPHRIFDGPYGLLSHMGFTSMDYNEDGKVNSLTFYLDLGGSTPVSVNYMTFGSYNGKWVHVAAAWDRSGIGSSEETMQLFINGAKVSSSTEKGWGTAFGQRADIAGGNDNNIAQQFYVDEMKIYDFAKTNF